jgi:hypothetical protein
LDNNTDEGGGGFDVAVFHVSKNNIVMDTTAMAVAPHSVFKSRFNSAWHLIEWLDSVAWVNRHFLISALQLGECSKIQILSNSVEKLIGRLNIKYLGDELRQSTPLSYLVLRFLFLPGKRFRKLCG